MYALTESEYNKVLRSGRELLLFLYQPGDPVTELMTGTLENIDGMLGKSFGMYTVDATREKEIAKALSVDSLPEVIFIKDQRIRKRRSGWLTENQILSLTK